MPTETILVTGGSRGIGAATTRLLAASGAAVCFTYAHQAETARQLVAEIEQAGGQACALRADAHDVDAFAQVVTRIPKRLPPLTGLVNNAGITGPLGRFDMVDAGTLREVVDVNLLATMRLTQAVVREWLANDRAGSIVNVSSIAATLGAPGEYVHYAATKAAIEAFTVGLAKELAEQRIRVNAVSPGTTLTGIHAAAGDPDRPRRVAARIPLKRPGEAGEIAAAIAWLLSPQASYVTGAVLKVAGGL